MNEHLFAKFDKALSLVRIFTLTPDPERQRISLNQDYAGVNVEILSRCGYLGVREQGVLLSLIAEAATSGRLLAPYTSDGSPSVLISHMFDIFDHEDAAVELVTRPVIFVTCTIADVIRAGGLKTLGGENFYSASIWLKRLSEVRLYEAAGRSARLIAFRVLPDGSIRIALHPRLSRAALPGGCHSSIRLDERATLQSSAGKLLHARLSAMHRPGCERPYLVATLAQSIWPDRTPEDAPGAWLKTTHEAVLELRDCGWKTAIEGSHAVITRRRLDWNRFKVSRKHEGGHDRKSQ